MRHGESGTKKGEDYTLIEQCSIRWYWVFAIRYWFYCVSHHILYFFGEEI